jgi:hypothetical protein
MTELSLDETVEQMTGPSSQRLTAFGAELRGVGADVIVAFNSLHTTVADLPGVGQSAAERIAVLRNDVESGHLPVDHRRRLEQETYEGASLLVKKMNDAAHKTIPKIRQLLEDGLLPSAARTDPGIQVLHRQEVQAAMAAQPAGTPLDRARSILGRSPAWDAQLLGGLGRALVGDDHSALRAEAALKWKERTDGTERQLASRRALAALERANLPGSITAFEAAARLHMSKDDRLVPRSG